LIVDKNKIEMEDRNSVKFIGKIGLLYTNEDGETFCVYTKTLSSGQYEKVLYAKDIRKIGCERELNDNEKEVVVSNILGLTKDVKWLIKD
jgi:hypothetical protein